MRIADMNWMQVEAALARDDRAVLPIGSTEQHAYLSLATDSLLAERVAAEAAAPLALPVFPVVPYGITPSFRAFPGTVTLRVDTLLRVVRDLLDALADQGFRRILVVNGHGGNAPVQGILSEWMAARTGVRARLHSWWNAPRTWAEVQAIDPVASHASWMENFPWTRLAGVALPEGSKPMADLDRLRALDPVALRAAIGEGNYGGRFARDDADLMRLWAVAVDETRAAIEGPWA